MTSKRQKKKGWLLPDEITDHELVCLSMLVPNDPDYIAALKGNIAELTKSWNWERSYTDGDDRAARASLYWRKIIFNSLEIGACGTEVKRTCTDYSNHASIVKYNLYDPFLEPDTIPSGYLFSPYVVIAANDILGNFLGYHVNDVLTSVGRVPNPPAIISQNLPGLSIELQGKGDLTLDLLAIEFGGNAIIKVDGTQVDKIDLFYDTQGQADRLIQVPLALKDGNHVVSVMFEPVFELSPFIIKYGGGFRGFTWCSEQQFKPTQTVTECEDEMNLRIKPDDCTIIQAQCADGSWQDWYNPACKANGSNGTAQQGQDDNPPKAGESKCYPMVLQGTDIKFIPIGVDDGDTITISGATGAWNYDAGNIWAWACPSGKQWVVDRCTSFDFGLKSDDPLPTVLHMRLIGLINGAYVDVMASGGYTVPSGTGKQQFYLQANDSGLGNNQGSISFNVCVQKAVDPATLPENQEWCYIFDFKQSAYGWVSNATLGGATWVSGSGWKNVAADIGIEIDFTASRITSIHFEYVYDNTCAGSHDAEVIFYDAIDSGHRLSLNTLTSPTGHDDWSGDLSGVTKLFIAMNTDTTSGCSTPDGVMFATRCVIGGKGTIPPEFGSSNC